jgi:uncharacterized protein (UPF0332 family)
MLEDLERDGYIRKITSNREMVNESLKLAHRDVKVAGEILSTDADWAFNIAYNSILQAVRGLMFAKGYRPSGRKSHIAVVKFAMLYLEEEDVLYFERMRRKRHKAVYDTVGVTSFTEAEKAIRRAQKILSYIERLLKE